MLDITYEQALRTGVYYRVMFKFKGEREWLPTIHIFGNKKDAKAKADELRTLCNMAHTVAEVKVGLVEANNNSRGSK